MFSKSSAALFKNFNYDSNPELALRQACEGGDLAKVHLLIENHPTIDINAKGEKSGQSALHRACENGYHKIACYLVTKGADVHLKNANGLSALDICAEKFPKLAECLSFIPTLIEARKTAINLFPIRVLDTNKEQVKTRDKFREKTEALFKSMISDYLAKQSKLAIHISLLEQTDKLTSSILFLFEINSYLSNARELNHQLGSCGELARAAFAYLMEKLSIPVEYFRINVGYHRSNHSFLVINRDPNGNIKNPKTWGNAFACDAFDQINSIYSVDDAPKKSAIDILQNDATDIIIYMSNQKPDLSPFSQEAREFYESYWHKLSTSNTQLVNNSNYVSNSNNNNNNSTNRMGKSNS